MAIQQRVVKVPFSKEEMRSAFVSLDVARTKRNRKKHIGIVRGREKNC